MDWKNKGLRDLEVTTGSGEDVKDTPMLKGEAKDSLHGKNVMKQHWTEGLGPKGKLGGEASGE